jgi:hypothetical protein
MLLSGAVVDDYQMTAGKNATSSAIAEDAAGNLYVGVGAIDAAGAHHAVVRRGMRQADGSVAWGAAPVVDFSLAPDSTRPGPQSSFKDLAIDPASGNLFAAGQALDAAGVTHWVVVKRSPDGTVTLLDDYRYAGGKSADARGITLDAAGNLFVVGSATDATASSAGHWVVRELKAGASAWQTVDDFLYQPGVTVSVSDVVVAPSGVYVVGSGSGQWLTRKGVGNGAGGIAWTTSTFKADPNFNSAAFGAGVDAAGNVYAVGSARKATGPAMRGVIPSVSQWTVRRTGDAGATWATIDIFQLSGNTSLAHSAAAFRTDVAGNLYVAGYAPGTDNVQHAVVRSAGASGAGWVTLDDWQLVAGRSAFVSGLFVDHAGTVYTAGNANDSGNIRHGIVRRINTPAAPSAAAPFFDVAAWRPSRRSAWAEQIDARAAM